MNEAVITDLVHHPAVLPLPSHLAQTENAGPMPSYLTKAERLKWKRRVTQETEKQKRVEISLGLREAPAPRVRLSNLHRVLGPEASQRPTEVLEEVVREVQGRVDEHHAQNQARKLTKDERKAKRISKMQQDQAAGLFARVLVAGPCEAAKMHFKLKKLAQKWLLSGVLLKMSPERSLVLIEGGCRGLEKWTRWQTSRDEGCRMVWHGSIEHAAYRAFSIHLVDSPVKALKILTDHGVPHYWKLALPS
ncbi:MAG: pre-mRNA processing factor 3 family protein [archaeon]|nr:pre-mRNA processing factor 3 family protein [archaeon]